MIYFIFFISFLIRLIGLNQSLWLDEAITAKVVSSYSYFDIVNKFSLYDFHPPLYYFFLKFWTNIFGYSEIALRFPSVFFSLLTGYFIYLIGKEIKDKKTSFWAMIFFLFNPLIVYYSQEARMYMMTTFLLMIALYFFIKIKNSEFKIYFFLFNSFLVLSFYTFYGSIFFISSIFLYLFFRRRYKFLFISLLIIIYSLLIIYPLLYHQYLNSKLGLISVKNWSLVLGKANFKNLFLIPIKFSVGRINFYPKWLYYLISGIWTIFLFFQILNIKDKKLKKETKNEKIKLIYFLFFVPIFLSFIVSFFTPLLQYFRFLYLIPIFCLLLALLINNKLIYKIIFFGFLFFSCLYLFNSDYHREDWKSLSFFLRKNNIKEVFMIKSSSDPLIYYNNKIKIVDLKNVCDRAFFLNKKIKDIFVIPYSSEIWGINYKECLKNKGYQLFFEKSFRGLKLEKYSIH